MNFQDIINKNNQQQKTLGDMGTFISEVEMARIQGENIYNWLFEAAYKASYNSMSSILADKYRVFREYLIAIDAYELGTTIINFKNIYNNTILNGLLNDIENDYKNISRIRKITSTEGIIKEYLNCINSLDSIIENYKRANILVEYLNSVNVDLLQGVEDSPFTVRFFNESNTVSSLLENITLMKNIYANVNELVGDGTELKYCRVESGTFEMILIGCIPALLTIKPLLEFAYKVYSEQFSPKARLELKEKEIKVRGDYLKLLKEATESKNIAGFNVKDKEKIVTIIANLDINIKKLYSSNPFIKINNEGLGTEEMKNKNVPLGLIKSSEDDVISLIALDNTEI